MRKSYLTALHFKGTKLGSVISFLLLRVVLVQHG